jgi:membrane protease YdiL (CAAX protease family)
LIFAAATGASHPPGKGPTSSRFFYTALAFEVGLAAVALAIGWLVSFPPTQFLRMADPQSQALGAAIWGVAAAVPMLAAMLLLDRFPWGPLRRLQQFVHEHLVPLFAPLSVGQMVVISIAAGLGEELLFRGLIQAGLAELVGEPWGVLVGLLVASLLFGLCHCVTATYGVLATLVGLYLGVLFLVSESLWPPIITHAVYDAMALVYLVRFAKG